MKIIPVIDLLAGQVVHARLGQRASYRPIRSCLCDGSDPLDVVRGYRNLFEFTAIYVADLDAIEGAGNNEAAIRSIRNAFGDVELWVDNGLATIEACQTWLDQGLGDLVIGSEAQDDPAVLAQLRKESRLHRAVLSLDFKGERFLGPPALLENSAAWPERVIVMTLARVGSGQGPDKERLAEIRSQAGGRKVFAAGGVRSGADLRDLARMGVSGALVASALHDGRIARRDVASLSDCHPQAG